MHPPPAGYGEGEWHHVPPPPPHPPAPTSGTAVASLVFGVLGLVGSWCLFGVPSIIAIILGHVATSKTKRGLRPGHGLAVAGLILGYIVVVPALIVTLIIIASSDASSLAGWVNAVLSWLDSMLN
uniref:DUF4190 domain-containing protein n=1 Tax=Nonomuraea sp. NPDC003804 TaxID=3154547 RepID=UPI0033AF1870